LNATAKHASEHPRTTLQCTVRDGGTGEEVEESLLAVAEAAEEQMRNGGRGQLKVLVKVFKVSEQLLALNVRACVRRVRD
jgi:hypothetical protein